MLTRTCRPNDLILVLTEDGLTILGVDGVGPRLLVRVPSTLPSAASTMIRVLGTLIRSDRPGRVLVSVKVGTPHEEMIVPFVDALDALRAEHGFAVVWLPDLYEIVALLSQSPMASSSP